MRQLKPLVLSFSRALICEQTIGWERYSHEQIGLKGWGASGPYEQVYKKFGITGPGMTFCLVFLINFQLT